MNNEIIDHAFLKKKLPLLSESLIEKREANACPANWVARWRQLQRMSSKERTQRTPRVSL
jgi:hypothetical protein